MSAQAEEKAAFWGIFATRYAKVYPAAIACLEDDFASLTEYLRFPRQHWKRIRHSNFIERTFGETRWRVKVIGRLPGEASCLSLVWAVLDRAGCGWRGVTQTSESIRLLQDLRRQLLEPQRELRPPTTKKADRDDVTTAASHHQPGACVLSRLPLVRRHRSRCFRFPNLKHLLLHMSWPNLTAPRARLRGPLTHDGRRPKSRSPVRPPVLGAGPHDPPAVTPRRAPPSRPRRPFVAVGRLGLPGVDHPPAPSRLADKAWRDVTVAAQGLLGRPVPPWSLVMPRKVSASW